MSLEPVDFDAKGSNGELVPVSGFKTPVPGLLLAPFEFSHADGRVELWWGVSHRSGCRVSRALFRDTGIAARSVELFLGDRGWSMDAPEQDDPQGRAFDCSLLASFAAAIEDGEDEPEDEQPVSCGLRRRS